MVSTLPPIFWLVLLTLCGGVYAYVAKRRGGNPEQGFFTGLLLGGFALLSCWMLNWFAASPNFWLYCFIMFLVGLSCSHFARRQGYPPLLGFLAGFSLGLLGFFSLLLASMAHRAIKKRGIAQKRAQPRTWTMVTSEHPMGEPLNGTYEFEGRICASQREKLWYYLDEERAQLGPMSFQALTQAVHQGLVTPSTYLWNEELDQWTTLGELTIRTPPAEFSTSSP